MIPRQPFDSLSLGQANVPLSPLPSIQQGDGCESLVTLTDENSSLALLHEVLGESNDHWNPGPKEPEKRTLLITTPTAPLAPTDSRTALTRSRRFADFDHDPSHDPDAEAKGESEDSTSEESPEDDDDDDYALRAMAFARMRAPSFGLGAAMSGFNSMLLSDDKESESGSAIRSVVSTLVSTISSAPVAPERCLSQSVVDCYQDDEDLTSLERKDCDMVLAFTKRWAENIKLESTYWQGAQPLPYKERSVPTGQYFTLYKTEQAIRNVSTYLNIPPPLEVDLPQPRLSWDPVHVGLACCTERGCLLPRLPGSYCPSIKLQMLRDQFNANIENENKKVKIAESRVLAGAKRDASKLKEAHTRRVRWAHGPSKLWLDISPFVSGEAVDRRGF